MHFPIRNAFPIQNQIQLAWFFVYFCLPRPTYTGRCKSGKEHFMETNRVLSRVGARLVSEEELQQVAGGFKSSTFFGSGLGTGACNYDPVTCRVISGDCSDNPPPCLGQ